MDEYNLIICDAPRDSAVLPGKEEGCQATQTEKIKRPKKAEQNLKSRKMILWKEDEDDEFGFESFGSWFPRLCGKLTSYQPYESFCYKQSLITS